MHRQHRCMEVWGRILISCAIRKIHQLSMVALVWIGPERFVEDCVLLLFSGGVVSFAFGTATMAGLLRRKALLQLRKQLSRHPATMRAQSRIST